MGSLFASALEVLNHLTLQLGFLHPFSLSQSSINLSSYPALGFSALWFLNHAVRRFRLGSSRLFERRASASLLNRESLQAVLFSSFALVTLAAFFAFARIDAAAVATGAIGVLLMRYLFFVSVVPLNMALTFVRGGRP